MQCHIWIVARHFVAAKIQKKSNPQKKIDFLQPEYMEIPMEYLDCRLDFLPVEQIPRAISAAGSRMRRKAG